MIECLTVDLSLVEKSPELNYIAKLPLFKQYDGKFQFKKGINVIFSENGSGKSTLLNMLAKATFCQKFGYSKVDQRQVESEKFLKKVSQEELDERGDRFSIACFSFEAFFHVSHDRRSVLYCDPKFIIGSNPESTTNFVQALIKEQSVERINFKGSTGNKNKHRMTKINDALNGVSEISDEFVFIDNVKPDDQLSFKLYSVESVNKQYLSPSIKRGQKTLLIDEPEFGLDLLSKIKWFKELEEKAEKQDLQIIMISHSELVFQLKNANFIGDEKYIEQCKDLLKN